MTTQKSKSPESIAEEIVCEWYGTSGCQQIYEGIVKAIKAERENIQHTYKQQNIRMTNKRLVLPEKKWIPKSHEFSIEYATEQGFNHAIDEITRLNDGRVFNKIPIVVDKDMPENEIELRGQYNSIKITNIKLDDGRVKPLELPGYSNQCAHDVSPSDFDRGAEYGFNKCLNEIYEMNPYLKLDEK